MKKLSAFCVFLMVVCLTLPAAAQPLADQVPDTAIIYIAWQGVDQPGAGYEGSHLQELLDQSQFRELFTQMVPGIFAKLGEFAPPDAEPGIEQARTFLSALTRYPTAVYFTGVDWAGHEPTPQIVLISQAGDEAEALHASLEQMLAEAGAPPHLIRTSQADGRLVVLIGHKVEPLVARHAAFASARAKVHADPFAMVYVNVDRLLTLVDEGIAFAQWQQEGWGGQPDDQPAAIWSMIRTGTGLDGVHQLIWTAAMENRQWHERMFIDAPSPRQGLASLLTAKTVSMELLDLVPQTAAQAGVMRFDFAEFFQETRRSLDRVDPQLSMQMDGGLAMGAMLLGIDLERTLIASLGDEWVYYGDAGVGGIDGLGLVVINNLRDPEGCERAMRQVSRIAADRINPFLENVHMRVSIRQSQVGQLTIHTLALPLVAPSWAVHDGKLYLAAYPQVVASAVDHVTSQRPTLRSNERFLAMVGDGAELASVHYIDLPQFASDSYQSLLMMTQLFTGAAELFGVDSPVLAVPSLHELRKHLEPIGVFTWNDEAGWHMHSVSPFPGAMILTQRSGMGAVMYQQAMMGAMMGGVRATEPSHLSGPTGIRRAP